MSLTKVLSLSLFSLLMACSTTSKHASDNIAVVKKYYEAYNAKDPEGQIALMSDDFTHEPNQGTPDKGKEKYLAFAKDNQNYYDEKCIKINYLVSPENSNLVATDFWVEGKYAKTAAGYPPAKNQPYYIRAAEIFELKGGKITRLSTYYNEQEWLRQIKK